LRIVSVSVLGGGFGRVRSSPPDWEKKEGGKEQTDQQEESQIKDTIQNHIAGCSKCGGFRSLEGLFKRA